MKLAVSILGINKNIVENIKKLSADDVSYLHIDIMDGKFVSNKTVDIDTLKENLKDNTKPLDCHLMVSDVKNYVEEIKTLKPEYITFHYEVIDDLNSIINLIKGYNIKVGIAIKPKTDPALLLPYLDKIDLVLVMTVEPGKGGQTFMKDMDYKLDDLIEMRKNANLKFKIEVDGGINDETIKEVKKVDMAVVGSFITNSNDYNKQIKIIKENLHARKTK